MQYFSCISPVGQSIWYVDKIQNIPLLVNVTLGLFCRFLLAVYINELASHIWSGSSFFIIVLDKEWHKIPESGGLLVYLLDEQVLPVIWKSADQSIIAVFNSVASCKDDNCCPSLETISVGY